MSLLLHNFHGAQLFCARGTIAILLITELAPSMDDDEDEKRRARIRAVKCQDGIKFVV